MKTIEEVKKAVDEGKLVFWSNSLYEVKYWRIPDQYVVLCTSNDCAWGLNSADVKDCYIEEKNND